MHTLKSPVQCLMACCIQSKHRIAIALKIMLDDDNLPTAIHCTHGKDRTGIIVMLLLLLCNVSSEVSNRHMPCCRILPCLVEVPHADVSAC